MTTSHYSTQLITVCKDYYNLLSIHHKMINALDKITEGAKLSNSYQLIDESKNSLITLLSQAKNTIDNNDDLLQIGVLIEQLQRDLVASSQIEHNILYSFKVATQ